MTTIQNNEQTDAERKAEEMTKENGLTYEQNLAYVENVGAEYAEADEAEEAFAGEYTDDEAFAQELADELGSIKDDTQWPYTCIDWDKASEELMYDYFESNGYYFRNV